MTLEWENKQKAGDKKCQQGCVGLAAGRVVYALGKHNSSISKLMWYFPVGWHLYMHVCTVSVCVVRDRQALSSARL